MDSPSACGQDGRALFCSLDFPYDGSEGIKKNEYKPHLKLCWCIPPHHNARFVAAMEDVLSVYACPYDSACPVVCMDEKPFQLLDIAGNDQGDTKQTGTGRFGISAQRNLQHLSVQRTACGLVVCGCKGAPYKEVLGIPDQASAGCGVS